MEENQDRSQSYEGLAIHAALFLKPWKESMGKLDNI